MIKFCGKEMLIQSLDLLHVPVIFGSDIRCPIFQCLILCHLFDLLSNVQCLILCPMSNVQRLELQARGGVLCYPVFKPGIKS